MEQVLVGGGFAVVAVALIKFLMDRNKSQDKVISNHIKHSAVTTAQNTAVMEQNSKMLGEVKDACVLMAGALERHSLSSDRLAVSIDGLVKRG